MITQLQQLSSTGFSTTVYYVQHERWELPDEGQKSRLDCSNADTTH